MCGLAGVMIGPNKGDQEIARFVLRELLDNIEHRGHHATGVGVYAERDKPGRIWKVAEPAKAVLKSKSFNDFLDHLPGTSRIFIGHTRWATHGAKEKNENAHPFQKGKVIGAHNGVIDNYRDLAKTMQVEVPNVDSEIVFTMLDRFKDPVKVLPELEGYFALTWIKGGRLFVAKSDGAQFCFGYVPSLHMLAWASTQQALTGALSYVGLKGSEFDVYTPKEDTIYRFDANAFDDKGTNRISVECTFKRRKTFYRGANFDHRNYGKKGTMPSFRPGGYSDWDDFKRPWDASESTVVSQPDLFVGTSGAVSVDRRSATGGKPPKRLTSGASTGKEPEDTRPRTTMSFDTLQIMVERLVIDRANNIRTINDLISRVNELERQQEMLHDAIYELWPEDESEEEDVGDCLYCRKEITDADLLHMVRLPQGVAHYGCLFGEDAKQHLLEAKAQEAMKVSSK